MATEQPREETNKDIFDDYVRQAAGDEYIDKPAEVIFERLENGEESLALCINALAITQAAFMMTVVYAPYKEPEWKREVRGLRRRFSEVASQVLKGIESSIRDTAGQWVDKKAVGSDLEQRRVFQNFMKGVNCYRLLTVSPQWLWEFSELPSLSTDQIDEAFLRESVIAQDIDFALRRADFFQKQDGENGSLYRFYGEESAYYEPVFLALFAEDRGWPATTKWHRRYAASNIQSHVETNRGWLQDFHWGALLDICLWEVRELPSTELPHEPPSNAELRGDIVDLFGLNSDDSEYWAWLFGCLSSSWHDRVESTGADHSYSSYEAYTPAFALMDGSFEPGDPLGPTLLGMIATWKREATEFAFIHSERDLAPAFVSHVSYWIAKLGYRYTRKPQNQDASPSRPTLAPVLSPSSKDVPSDLDIEPSANTPNMNDFLKRLDELEEQFYQSSLPGAIEQAEQRLQEQLHSIWNKLPQDIKRHLVRAHVALQDTLSTLDPTLEMGFAVEIALGEWLVAPSRRQTPGRRDTRIGNWISYLTGNGAAARAANLEDSAWRGRYDWNSVDELIVSLRILRDNRNPAAHAPGVSPEPIAVAEIVLGDENSPNIFELILRFAKKWPPKEQ